MDYYEKTVRPSALRCLICRRTITIIITNFAVNDSSRDLHDKITRFNKVNLSGFNFVSNY